MAYPTSLDSLTNPAPTDTLNSPSHSDQHINANNAIEAIEAKVGANSSAVTTSHDYKLSGVTGTEKAVSTDRMATTSVKGISKLSTAPASATEPIAVGDNDTRVPTVNTSTVTAGMVAALAGTSGTPAVGNKYVTNDDTTGTGDVVRESVTNLISAGISFGGNGTDGALAITTGTTTLDLGGVAIFIKNYTSISITGDGKLAFSNPNTNGTIIILKSQGNVTLTSSTVPCLDLSGMGGAGGAVNGSGYADTNTLDYPAVTHAGGSSTTTGGVVITANSLYSLSNNMYRKLRTVFAGSGGGGGETSGGTGGVGGAGGGGLIIECGGALNFTGTISVNGVNGGNASNSATGGGGAGGGGSAGNSIIIYNSLTANSGTITSVGGAGGTGGVGTGGGGSGGKGGAGAGNAGGNGANSSGGGGGGGSALSSAAGGAGGTGGASTNIHNFAIENRY